VGGKIIYFVCINIDESWKPGGSRPSESLSDESLKGTFNHSKFVTPVKTGVQSYQDLLDFPDEDRYRNGIF